MNHKTITKTEAFNLIDKCKEYHTTLKELINKEDFSGVVDWVNEYADFLTPFVKNYGVGEKTLSVVDDGVTLGGAELLKVEINGRDVTSDYIENKKSNSGRLASYKDLQVGDNVISEPSSPIATGGHSGEVVKIDDNFIYTQIKGKIEKWDKFSLRSEECSGYFLEWKTPYTYKEYWDRYPHIH